MQVSTVDFEKAVKQWLDAEDDWKDFYKDDDKSIQINEYKELMLQYCNYPGERLLEKTTLEINGNNFDSYNDITY